MMLNIIFYCVISDYNVIFKYSIVILFSLVIFQDCHNIDFILVTKTLALLNGRDVNTRNMACAGSDITSFHFSF